jgi:GNAT superfamily N-acetyltransferase
VRPVLEEIGALPRVLAIGATLRGRPVGLAVALQGWTPSDSPLPAPRADTARLLSLTVSRAHRRLGVGAGLLAALERALAERGIREVTATASFPVPEGRVAAETLFARAQWEPSELVMLQCQANEPLLDAPLMRAQADLPAEYEIVDWVDLTLDERAQLHRSRASAPWFPEALDPFDHEVELEIRNSLALRFRGEIVGWLLTFRTGETTMYYRCMFVREDLARLGRALALLREAIIRHARLIAPAKGFGEWSTPASMPAMVRFIRRHLEPYGATVVEQRRTRKVLAPVAAPSGESPHEKDAPQSTDSPLPSERPQGGFHVAALNAEECARACEMVTALRADWKGHEETLPWWTLSTACAELAWLHALIADALERALGAPVRPRGQSPAPQVLIRPDVRGARLPISAIHTDVHDAGGRPRGSAIISFSLLLSPSSEGVGMTEWDLTHDEAIGLDTEERNRLLKAVPKSFLPHPAGTLLVHSGRRFHQVSPLTPTEGTSGRITVEGHAILEGECWSFFGD